MTVVAAVDFGASSIRVCRVELTRSPPHVEVVHRYRHGPVTDADGHLRWDWPRLVQEMQVGLAEAQRRGPLASVGVDTWGVDYGLIDGTGSLVSAPFCYRDSRTDGFRGIAERIGVDRLLEVSGVQLQPFNTIFQLAVHDPAELARASRMLLLPELLVHHLTGVAVGEPSSAGTTGLLDLDARTWSPSLCDAIGVDPSLLPELRPATSRIGSWEGVPVHLVGGHDTASAVVGMGSTGGDATAFVSAGTWLLVGREQDHRTDDPAFSNEIGALGGLRVLRNVAGFWVLERCLPLWASPPIDALLEEAAATDPAGHPVDLRNVAFLNPDDMLGLFTSLAGLSRDAPPPLVARMVIESMAETCAQVIDDLGGIGEIALFGGGARSPLLAEALRARSQRTVHLGPAEATALGNALVQGIALGCFADLADARRASV